VSITSSQTTSKMWTNYYQSVGEAAALGNLRNPKPREERGLLTLKTTSCAF